MGDRKGVAVYKRAVVPWPTSGHQVTPASPKDNRKRDRYTAMERNENRVGHALGTP